MNEIIDGNSRLEPPQPQGYAPGAAPVYAEVNHGRWIAECPSCRQAEFVTRDHRPSGPEGIDRHKWFWCHACFNHALGNKLRPVLWPTNPEAIVRELRPRPLANRNWTPGETARQLRAENLEHAEELRRRLRELEGET